MPKTTVPGVGPSVIARFKDAVSWRALKSGKSSAEFAEAGTMRTCADCGHVVVGGLGPDVRSWTCPDCGAAHGPDENTARNGLRRILRERQENGGTSAPGMERTACQRSAKTREKV